MGLPYTLSETPPRVEKASPGLGEDNARILHDLLGMSAEEIAALEADGVISRTPDPTQMKGIPDTLPLEEMKALGIIRDYDPEYQEHIAATYDAPVQTRA